MARPGITYSQVAQAAETLTAAGASPTIAAVREALGGTGSPNTIHKHLAAWRDGQPTAAAGEHELANRLVSAIQEEINKATAGARAELETALHQAQDEATELAKTGEAIEAERDSLAETLERLAKQRDQWEAVEEELRQANEAFALAAKNERANTEEAQKKANRASTLLETEIAKNQDQAAEIAQLRKELALTVKERGDAFQACAVMQAKLEAAERRATEAETREKTTAGKLEKIEDQARKDHQELSNGRLHIQAQQMALDTAARELDALKKKTTAKPTKAKATTTA